MTDQDLFPYFVSGYLKIVKSRHHSLNSEKFALFIEGLSLSLSKSQIESKKWLIDIVNQNNLNLGLVFLCAGWHATLILFKNFKFDQLRNFDIDPQCKEFCDDIYRQLIVDNWKYLSVTEDIMNINYSKHRFTTIRQDGTTCEIIESPDTIINTSCEHIDDFNKWYSLLPKNKLIILQSNNGFGIDGHVNCSHSLIDFIEKTPMSNVIYSGEKKMPKFMRYMRIGYK